MRLSSLAVRSGAVLTIACLASAIADGGGETTPPCVCTEWLINIGSQQVPNWQQRTACLLANLVPGNADEFYCKTATVADGPCPTTKKCSIGGDNEDSYDRVCTITTKARAEALCYGDPYNFSWTSRCREAIGACGAEE